MNNDNNQDQTFGDSSPSSDKSTFNPTPGTLQDNQMDYQTNPPRQDYIQADPNQSPGQPSPYEYSNEAYTEYSDNQGYPQDVPLQDHPIYGYHSEDNTYPNSEPMPNISTNSNNQEDQSYLNTPEIQGQPAMSNNSSYNDYAYPQDEPATENPNYTYTQETTAYNKLKPKKPRKWLLSLTAIPILAVILILCFCFVPPFRLFVYRNFLGSTRYYEYVEHSCSEELTEQAKDLNVINKDGLQNGTKSTSTLSFQLESSLTKNLGFDLNKLTCEMTNEFKDKRATNSYAFMYDGKKFATLELYSELENGKIYLRIPELNEKYIDFSTLLASLSTVRASSSLDSPSSGLLNLSTTTQRTDILNCMELNSDTTNELVKKIQANLDPQTISKLVADYTKFIIDDLGKRGAVKLSKGEDYDVNGVVEKCDKFTISLTQAKIKEVMIDVLKNAKEDKTIKKIVSDITGLETVYPTAIDACIDKVNALATTDDKKPLIKMEVYTDGHTIHGRSFSFLESDDAFTTFEYGIATDNNQTGAMASLYTDKKELLRLNMDSQKNEDAYSGSVSLSINDDEKNYIVYFEDCKINENNQMEGSLRFELDDTHLDLLISSENEKQKVELSGDIHEEPLGSISLTTTSTKDSAISIPEVSGSSVATPSNKETFATFLKESKLEQFIQTLLSTFHVDAKVTAKQLSDAIIYSVEHDTNLKDALSTILGEIQAPKTPSTDPDKDSPSKTPDKKDDKSGSSSYKPEDYNLPSGTKISQDGDYTYNLSNDELNALKQKGSDVKSFTKTKDEVYPFVESLAKRICGSDASCTTDVYNSVSGNVKDSSNYVSHYTELSWFSSSSSYENYVVLKYDSLNNKVIDLTVSCTDKSKINNLIAEACKILGATAPSGDLEKKIQDQLNSTKDFSDITDLADSSLYLHVTTPGANASYYFKISVKDN